MIWTFFLGLFVGGALGVFFMGLVASGVLQDELAAKDQKLREVKKQLQTLLWERRA